ncbi:MAG TPA: 16S rRNA (adenine(1518)-N(6)/adenine(1519)-N(6))-dimethyltransferase RsmA [Clostridiales bacterium]|jgi:16S rRNA (adenine1518-N6/adenine1519-N6)-dimethyltransferase|nr:16S rRNA (adenine(1518)-N(6)/adenine(1519)-N(6))-dimethyltransferase RsmA [Clostridiales bacterium]
MGTLGNPKNTIEILKKYSFVFQKKFGQNFLIDNHVIEKIIRAADITKDDFVLEIGPGIGTLTQHLCENSGHVLAIEIDRRLIPILEETLSDYDNVTILNEDILKVDIASLVKDYNDNKPVKIVANLPYYITTPIIMDIFEKHIPLSGVTVMIQKEVADRIQAKPGSKDYGALSLAVQYYAKPGIIANVPPNCFMPRPKVGSAVINLIPYKNPPYHVENEKLLFSLIRASFNQRRKTLVNGIFNYEGLDFNKEDIVKVLDDLGIARDIRGEDLSLEQFVAIANHLYVIKYDKFS